MKSLLELPQFPARYAVLLLFLAIHIFVLFNVLAHPPGTAYDAGAHLYNIQLLAEGRLPTPADSDQFFSPPLPYTLPALALAGGLPEFAAQKFAQLLNLLLSLATIAVLIRLTRLIVPRQNSFTLAALAILALMPVYYRSFSFIRGEPWVTFFSLLVVYDLLAMAINQESGRTLAIRAARLGIWLGLAVLSRQWGFSLWLAVALFFLIAWWRAGNNSTTPQKAAASGTISGQAIPTRPVVFKITLLTFAIALTVGGWFYLFLQLRYDSFAAFNRPLHSFSLANQPPSFYSGLGNGKLFSEPVRPSFPNQLWPKFYADFWGDYETYFLVYGRDMRSGKFLPGIFLEEAIALDPPWLETNRVSMSAYLGRANRLALGMSALFAAAFLFGANQFRLWLKGPGLQRITLSMAFIWLAALISFAGYLVFVIIVPNPGNGDTVKAVYLLHTTPLIALLSAGLMDSVRARTNVGYALIWLLIIFTYLALIPTFYTHYF
jgi:hypothetical protein